MKIKIGYWLDEEPHPDRIDIDDLAEIGIDIEQ